METLTDVLRRYIYFIEEKDLEYDIQLPENLNQFYLINNYSAEIPKVLKEVSTKTNLSNNSWALGYPYRL